MIAAYNGSGRPEKFGPVHIRFFKEVVGKLGLIQGHNFILQNGIKINNKVRKVEISVPTLSKYVRRSDEYTGAGIVLCSRSKMLDGTQKSCTRTSKDCTRTSKEMSPIVEVRRGPGRPKKNSKIINVSTDPGFPKKSA